MATRHCLGTLLR